MAYTATHKYARISARKVRALANLVRGKFADEALDILRFQPHRGARMLEKVIKSALGNAEHKQATDVDELVVVDARIDEGPMFKRFGRGPAGWHLGSSAGWRISRWRSRPSQLSLERVGVGLRVVIEFLFVVA